MYLAQLVSRQGKKYALVINRRHHHVVEVRDLLNVMHVTVMGKGNAVDAMVMAV